MISKKYRLTEKEVKRVLQRWKPFFSSWIVLNFIKNKKEISRFAIVIWWKSTKTAVARNFFRRRFYDFVAKNLLEDKIGFDFVFVVKKQTKLDKNDEKSLKSFLNDLKFISKKI